MGIFKGEDMLSAAFFVVVGAAFGCLALFQLPLGTFSEMGSGLFPLIVSICLVLIGVVLGLKGLAARNGSDLTLTSGLQWRPLVLISVGPVIFGVLIERWGMVSAVFAAAFVSSFASSSVTPVRALLVASGLTAACALIFHVALGLPIPLFGR